MLIDRAAVGKREGYIMSKIVRDIALLLWLAFGWLVIVAAASNVHSGVGSNYGYAYLGNSNTTGVYVGPQNSGVLVDGLGCEVWQHQPNALFVVDCFRQGS